MKITFDSRPKDLVYVEPDGTLFTSFMATGRIQSVCRLRFAGGTDASLGSFSITEAKGKDEAAPSAYAVVFVNEVAGVEKIAIMERFDEEGDARQALEAIHRAIVTSIRRTQRRLLLRRLAVYILLPLATLALLSSVLRWMDSQNSHGDLTAAILKEAAMAPVVDGAGGGMAPAGGTIASSARLGDASFVKDGIRFGLKSAAPERTLYVFSDPNCPSCKEFHSELKKLGSDFAIYVFPLAFKQGSEQLSTQALCAKDQWAMWNEIAALPVGAAPAGVGSCDLAGRALKNNMAAFTALGFSKTPTILGGNGTVVPGGTTASDIKAMFGGK